MTRLLAKLSVFAIHLTYMYVLCDRMTSKIYENIKAENFCFRLLNATHEIGCTSSAAGNVGVVHVVETSKDINWILHEGPDPPYIAALYADFFNMGNMTNLKNSDRVTGVLILQPKNTSMVGQANSPDNACPNENYGLYKNYTEYASCAKGDWNPPNPARNMLHENWGIPIVLVTNDSDIESIVNGCYRLFNAPINNTARPWPLCSAELGSFMLAAKDSPTCMRRSSMYVNMNPVKLCDPLGSRNVISMLFPTNKDEKLNNRSVIVVAARLDAASMFDGIAPGADSAVTSLITLMAVAHTLANNKDEISKYRQNNANVLFAVFNGEAFDYIGSSRVVYDMEKNVFPQDIQEGKQQPATMNLNHISHFIELHQVGPQNDTESWIHTDPISIRNPSVNTSVNKMVGILQHNYNQSFHVINSQSPLPPASVQRFLKKDLNIASVVITDFKNEYKNKHFNSRFDLEDDLLPRGMLVTYLTDLSTAVSKSVFELLTGKRNSNLTVDHTVIEDMLECYLMNASCSLFQQIASPSKLVDRSYFRTQPYSLYVSVDNRGNFNPITIYTHYLMSYLTGEKLDGYVENNCTANDTDYIYQYDWMVGQNISNPGVCVRSTVRYTLAISPAAEFNDWTSTEYSTWTESVWQTATLRIFLRPSRKLEGLTLGVGCIIFALSLLLVYSANKRAELLFGSRGIIGC